MDMSQAQRQALARKRILNILKKHGIATMRTLEQKISDGGPFPQRIDPHVITNARDDLLNEKTIEDHKAVNTHWYHLAITPFSDLTTRFSEQESIHRRTQGRDFTDRMGQALEIAVYRALLGQSHFAYLGAYTDLDAHDDSLKYTKIEHPDAISGKFLEKKKLDFVLIHGGELVGIEVKNVREWFYPERADIKDLLLKCIILDAIPVFIARRIHYTTFKIITSIGGLVHETYNQLYPLADAGLAAEAKDKRLLGYHDIKLGNQPDDRLLKFIHTNLPVVLPEARQKFDASKHVIAAYANGKIGYKYFANTILHRALETPVEPDDIPF